MESATRTQSSTHTHTHKAIKLKNHQTKNQTEKPNKKSNRQTNRQTNKHTNTHRMLQKKKRQPAGGLAFGFLSKSPPKAASPHLEPTTLPGVAPIRGVTVQPGTLSAPQVSQAPLSQDKPGGHLEHGSPMRPPAPEKQN